MRYDYDCLGRITCAVCDGHSYEYVYDAQGNLKEKRSGGRRLISYAYDKAGQITAAFITGIDGKIHNGYLYDAFGAELEADEQFQNRIRYAFRHYGYIA